jgi:predicted dehydrogenase
MTKRATGARSFNVGVIGAGKRAASYFRYIPDDLRLAIRLTALVDPNAQNRAAFTSLFGSGAAVREYADADEMFEQAELDAVILAPPNRYHAHDAKLAISRGLHILLEKPVAISVDECRELWRAATSAARPSSVTVGFVLRYTPFYSKVKEIVSSGDLGSILAIDADENLGTNLTGLFHKGWRREDRFSGGFMVEKCCHDLDILNWLVDAPVERAFSFAKRTHFVRQQRPAGRLTRFEASEEKRVDEADFGDQEISEAFFTPSLGSPYDFPSDSPDHQAVLLDFDQGALASLTACMGQPRTTRRIKIFGTDGSLEGNLDDSTIVVHKPHSRGNGWDVATHAVDAEKGNHHGGDAVLAEAFWRTVADQGAVARAGLREGIEAVVVALAAQQSSASGQSVYVRALREQVFDIASPGAEIPEQVVSIPTSGRHRRE